LSGSPAVLLASLVLVREQRLDRRGSENTSFIFLTSCGIVPLKLLDRRGGGVAQFRGGQWTTRYVAKLTARKKDHGDGSAAKFTQQH
jgi:hypothetical protein